MVFDLDKWTQKIEERSLGQIDNDIKTGRGNGLWEKCFFSFVKTMNCGIIDFRKANVFLSVDNFMNFDVIRNEVPDVRRDPSCVSTVECIREIEARTRLGWIGLATCLLRSVFRIHPDCPVPSCLRCHWSLVWLFSFPFWHSVWTRIWKKNGWILISFGKEQKCLLLHSIVLTLTSSFGNKFGLQIIREAFFA